MLTHYLLIAVRNVERHRFTTIVAVAGLALGLACFIGARLFVSHIDGAERHFRTPSESTSSIRPRAGRR